VNQVKHPAKFSDPILERIAKFLDDYGWPDLVLDPFAGVGRVHELTMPRFSVGVELEPEWSTMHSRNIVGNALHLPFPDHTFDGLVSSPCLAQKERILCDDLIWRFAGDIDVGDRLLAFDEFALNPQYRGIGSRRRWRRTEVVRSEPKTVECVRVILANGDDIITTPEHPWLAYRYGYRGTVARWVPSRDLLSSPWVMRQMSPWKPRLGYDAGWLAGMLDGEGSLSLGVHGSPKLCCYQVEGPIADRVERLMYEFGYGPNRIVRKDTPAHCQKVANLYVTGGFANMLCVLGELRPQRLLAKWETLDISDRTVQADLVQVLAVEPAGHQDIQEIETTDGTYFGEGYLMHNCYGNRMADHHDAKERCRNCEGTGKVWPDLDECPKCHGQGFNQYTRMTYRHQLGRPLHPDNSGQLQWGRRYRDFHDRAWSEALRTLRPGALVVVNLSNHIRKGEEQQVAEWHMKWFFTHDCRFLDLDVVATDRMGHGANRNLRCEFEHIFVFRYQPERTAA
jgi:hypothetical protein